MTETKPCPYCGGEIHEDRRGRRLALRKTCGAPECQLRHQRALTAKWAAERPTYHRDAKREWRLRNPERHQRTTKAWWDAHRTEQYEINRRWRDANREHHKQLIQDWRRRNPAAGAGYAANRRGWMQTGVVFPRDWSRLVDRCGGRCFYCGLQDDLTIDHVIPLSRGGRHTIGNVLPACKPCNSSKQDRLLVEWRAAQCHGRGPRKAKAIPGQHSATRSPSGLKIILPSQTATTWAATSVSPASN